MRDKYKKRESNKRYRIKNREAILKRKKQYYLKNKERFKEINKKYSREYYYKNRKMILKKQSEWGKKHRDKINIQKRKYYQKNTEKIRLSEKRWRLNNRIKVFSHYGNECAWCGNKNIIILTIDHINGNGNKHRREVTNGDAGNNFYIWLIKNNFPEGFQTLCLNCNYAKRLGCSKEDVLKWL